MLLGRDAERELIGQLLEAARASRSGALVIRGEPGVGKTALLEDTLERAADMRVLRARGVESESELPFAGLHQLLRPALDRIDGLPEPQARALRAALGLSDGGSPEPFLVYSGCLTLLSELAERRPVLCLVDDAHWLDAASGDALQFVARRLHAEAIVVLFGAREGDVRRFDADGVPSLALSGLDPEAADALLRDAAEDATPAVRELLVAQTGGNALALVELPAALSPAQLAGEAPLPEALPLTRRVEEVFLERARRLSGDAQSLLLVAAADDTGRLAVVSEAAGILGLDEDALTEPERAGLLTVQGSRLRFRHPLVRSVVYGGAPSTQRRAAHRALAEVLADDDHLDRRAWHLAAASVGPDEDAVRALEAAAERAGERGAHDAAARALERAARLAPDAERGRHLARASWAMCLAGRNERAIVLADQAAPGLRDPLLRARLAQVRVRAASRAGRPRDLVATVVDVAREVGDDEPAAALELLLVAASAAWQRGDRDAFVEIAGLALRVPVPEGDERSAFNRCALDGFATMIEGDTATGVPLLTELVDRGARTDDPQLAFRASWAAAWLGDEARTGELVGRASGLARSRGDIGTLAEALGYSAARLGMGQRYDEALIAATEALELARELDAINDEIYPRAVIAIVAAVRGDDEVARRDGEEARAIATANDVPLFGGSLATHALALLDLGRGRWAEALERLEEIVHGESRALDPVAAAMLPDAIEAAVRAGRPERARVPLELLESHARYAPARIQPRLAYCRALVADREAATGHFEEAIARLGDADPLDRPRIMLLYGEHLRRERRYVEAREHLRAAIEAFEAMAAEPWAERARVELRASGETARRRSPATAESLTPQEQQIARMVSRGLTNKEVAAQLFLSPRTIDAHLRGVFGKLGITSRRELRHLPLDGAAGPAGEAVRA